MPSSAGDRETDLLTLLPFEKTRRSIMALDTPLRGVGDSSANDARPAPPIEDFAGDGDEFGDLEGSLDVEGSGNFEVNGQEGKNEDAWEDEEGNDDVPQPPENLPPDVAAIQREPAPSPTFPSPCLSCI